MSQPDSNWQVVSQFVSDLRNASRLATYVDSVVDIFQSGAWRTYTDATGRSDEWRACEFDYFLIACGAQYTEVQRLLTWDRARAVDLASAMESDHASQRRHLQDASAAWRSPAGTSLAELATKHGWARPTGQLRAPPVPARARVRARHGLTKDEHARIRRAEKVPDARRQELERLAESIVEDVASEIELRYLVDVIRDKLVRRNRETAPG